MVWNTRSLCKRVAKAECGCIGLRTSKIFVERQIRGYQDKPSQIQAKDPNS
jgi:hypothetical protein